MAVLRRCAGASALLVVSCNYFNEELADLIVEAPDGSATFEGGAGGVGSLSGFVKPADFCDPGDAVPVREADDQFIEVDVSEVSDDFSDLSSCGVARPLGGTDAYFRVELVAGERYHFHVRAAPEQDLAVYLLSSCDERTCVGSIDECPAGTDEHFSFLARNAGTHFLGIDGIGGAPTEVPMTFLATRSLCGDGVKQHSEVCDDGNVDETDDCDAGCRAVVPPGGLEVEPNGDRYGANVLALSSGTTDVRGNLGGPCDTDVFVVRLREGGSLRAAMQSAAGAACDSAPPVVLRVFDGSLARLVEVEGAGGACPSLDDARTMGLAAGEYYVSLRSKEPVLPFGYQLHIEAD